MSTTYAGANSYPTTITEPSDGDTRDAASVNVALEALADRTAYLKARHARMATFGGQATTGSATTTPAAVAAATATSCEVGDELIINWTLSTAAASGGTLNYRFKLLEDATPVSPYPDNNTTTGVLNTSNRTFRHVVTTACDVVAYVELEMSAGTCSYYGPGTAVSIIRIRP